MKPFSDEGNLVMKTKLVLKLQKVDDLASFLLLFLCGDALTLHLKMIEIAQPNDD